MNTSTAEQATLLLIAYNKANRIAMQVNRAINLGQDTDMTAEISGLQIILPSSVLPEIARHYQKLAAAHLAELEKL